MNEEPEIAADLGTRIRRKALFYVFVASLLIYIIVPNVANPA